MQQPSCVSVLCVGNLLGFHTILKLFFCKTRTSFILYMFKYMVPEKLHFVHTYYFTFPVRIIKKERKNTPMHVYEGTMNFACNL